MTGPAESGRLPLGLKLANGIGSIAYGVKDNGFSTFLLIFYNQVIGLDASLVSLALMIALLIDAVADPIIGHLSDRTYTRWGRRLPWLYLAPVPLALSWLLLWSPPADGGPVLLYLIVAAILVRTLVSCCEVPSQSLVPELTTDYDERTAITRFRFLFGWAGGLTMFFLANTVFLRADETHKVGQLNPEGYSSYGMAGAVLMMVAVLLSALGQHRRVAHYPPQRPARTTLYRAMAEIVESLRHPAALILLSAAAIAITSTQMTFTIANFLYLYVWQLSETSFAWLPWMLMGSVVAAFLAVTPLHRRFEKRETAIATGVISVIFWITPFALRFAGLWPEIGGTASTLLLFGFVFVSNVNAVIVMVSGQSMLADVVEASFVETRRRTEGIFVAGWIFVQKIATAFGIGITGLLIDWAGMPKKAVPGQVASVVIDRLTLAYCALVIIAAVFSTWFFSRFPISRADHAERLRQIAISSAQSVD